MGYFYPQAAVTLRILFEDFNFKTDASKQTPYPIKAIAKDVSVTVNDYSQADTFECEIDYKNFPFDPRSMRACGVTIHMQDMRKIFNHSNELDSLVQTADNTLFEGFTDDESITFDDSKRSVRLTGRDLTSLYIDQPYSIGTLPLTDKIDKVIRGLMDDQTSTKPMKLELRDLEAKDLPILASFMSEDGNHQLNGRKNVDRNQTYWEVIQDIVSRAGLICYVEIDKLVLTKPRALYNPSGSKVFVYGRNIKNFTMKRKLGRKKNFNVILRSFDEANKQVIEAKIPLEATDAWSKDTGIPKGEVKKPEVGPDGQAIPPDQWKAAPYISLRIPKCKDKGHLIETAQGVYEEIGRQQIEGSFETSEMETNVLNEKDSIFSLLKLRLGTPISITVNQGDLKGIHDIVVFKNGVIDEPATVKSRTQFLLRRGYDASIAQALATTMDKFANVFYTKSVKFSLSNEQGFKCNVDFINFIDTKLKPAGG